MANEVVEQAAPGRHSGLGSATLAYLLLSLCVLVAYFVLQLRPVFLRLTRLQTEIESLRGRVEAQAVLLPLYTRLMGMIGPEGVGVASEPIVGPLPQEQVSELPSMFAETAKRCGLSGAKVTPRADLLSGGNGRLQVEVSVAGRFMDFRRLLDELARAPYVVHIGAIELRSGIEKDDGLVVRLWLSVGA